MKNFGTIIDNFDTVTKQYVDNKDALKLDKAGGSITGNLTVGGNLTINGTTTTVDSTTLQVKDKLIEVAHGNTTTLTTPAGLVAPKYDGTNSGALVFDSTGTAYVGDVTLKDGNIDVANSELQPLATRTGLVGGNLVQYDSSAQTLKDSGKKISDLALKTDIPTDYVKYTAQTLTDAQKSQARSNIGAGTSNFSGNYNDLSNKPTNYVTTDTTQAISGKKTVVTPPDTDDSTQIANTSWVRTNYQEKGYAGIDGAVVNSDGKVTDKDGNVVDALYFKVASLTTSKAYLRTYLLAEVAMTNIVKEQATVLIRCTTESSTSAPNITITFDNYSYASLLLPKNIFVTADYKSGTAGATFTVWVKQDKDFMQQVWNVLSQNTRNYTTTSKREWSVFYSNITKATAVTDINAAPTGYTRIVANNNNRYSNLEENTYLWQQSQNAGITWKRYSDNTTRGVFKHNDDGTTETFVAQSDGFLFRPLDNNNTKSIKVDPKTGVLYPEQNSGADLGKTAQRWNAVYAGNTGVRSTGHIICDSKVISYSAVESNKEVPDFNGILKDDLYTTAPTKTRVAQYLARDKNGAYIGGLRIYHDTNGTIQSQLLCRSQNTDVQNYVYFQAQPDATSNAEKDKFAFIPHTNGNIDLGLSNNKWNNGYITNLQLCKVINGGGGNSMIQQNSDTSGADITVGSTGCPLKIQGKNARPTYRQGKDGTYANLALQSDIKNGTLTIQQNGNTVATFTANQSGNSTADITVPTALSELDDDINAIKKASTTTNSNAWAFSCKGNTVSSNSNADYCVSIGSGCITNYKKSIKIGNAYGPTPNNQSVTQIGSGNYSSSGRALYLGAGDSGFTYMNSAGSSWTSASDIRDKTDIQNIDHALDFIKKLKPITYVMNDRERYLIRDKDDNPILDENGKQQYDVEAHKRGDKKKHRRFAGLSAQDTYQAMLDCYNNDTNYAQIVDNNKFDHPDDEYLEQYSMSYERLVPFLIKAIQEQQEQIDTLKSKLGE